MQPVSLFPPAEPDHEPGSAGAPNDEPPAENWLAKLGFWTAVVSLFFVAVGGSLALWALLPALLAPWESSVVMSDSMAPKIKAGDVVVWRTGVPDGIGEGAVIVYVDVDNNRTVVHRVAEQSGPDSYWMKGDANPTRDSRPVTTDQIQGWGQLLVPFVGTPVKLWQDGRWPWVIVLGVAMAFAIRWTNRAWKRNYDVWYDEHELFFDGTRHEDPLWLPAMSLPIDRKPWRTSRARNGNGAAGPSNGNGKANGNGHANGRAHRDEHERLLPAPVRRALLDHGTNGAAEPQLDSIGPTANYEVTP